MKSLPRNSRVMQSIVDILHSEHRFEIKSNYPSRVNVAKVESIGTELEGIALPYLDKSPLMGGIKQYK